ncbi:gliding motility-associated C-terminal domain-containing protein [uncultured Algoriphagus sp.]|uniref:T9SS type B sorting domain-containing protein n=1 Tax=uncultured Algoriphagus sp. TaxID=417365 RepID=UPI0030EDCC53
MVFIDIDEVPGTFNSSSATLLFSDENGADTNCTDIVYAGLYWSGRVQTPGMTFELTKKEGFLDPVTLDRKKDAVGHEQELEYLAFNVYVAVMFDSDNRPFPQYEFVSKDGENYYIIRFKNDNTIDYDINQSGWQPLEDLQIKEENGTATATFKPIKDTANGMSYSFYGVKRSLATDYNEFIAGDNSIMVETSGIYTPIAYYTQEFDKRKLKIKPPGAADYLEIQSAGNAILFPDHELRELYVGYADVTEFVKEYGAGSYTVADLALMEGSSDATGMYGSWGLIVVYENSKMDFRDITIFDGYTYIESQEGEVQNGELEIKGFGAIQKGPVKMKLGIMAGEGDKNIGGDYLEILDQSGNWSRLSHPGNSTDNFFNSSIYTPSRMKNGELVENKRFPNLKNNMGLDLVNWEVPNPDNSLITNNQSSAKFRFGTNQDIYSLFAFAFSVTSYTPNIEANNKLISINGVPADESSTVKPGEEVTIQVDIRNFGTEATEQNKLVIPVPYNALFVAAEITPNGLGTVTFDPTMGIAGSIVWDMGVIPLLNSRDEIIASLSYTLKFTEDCFLLANDNCESLLAVSGSISGTGTISNQHFSGLPFVKGYKEDACEGNAIFGPLEIPISGKAEFIASNCQDFELYTNLKFDNIRVFCQRETPTDLADLITPSQEGFQVYFFTEEYGGTPLFNYYVNTALVGTVKVWVSEGPQGSCTGLRIPVEYTVKASSLPPAILNSSYCMNAQAFPFNFSPDAGYTLLYYEDNDPSTAPSIIPPMIDLSVPKQYSIWVSQFKEGECESPRKQVSISIEDCSINHDIQVSVTSNVENFTTEGEEIIFTITVKNPGDNTLFNVSVYENLQESNWIISELGPLQEVSYEVIHSVTSLDLENEFLEILAEAIGVDEFGTVFSDNDSKVLPGFTFVEGFLDYTLTSEEPVCDIEGSGMGQVSLSWAQEQSGSYMLADLSTGLVNQEATFLSQIQLIIEALPGNYSLDLVDSEGHSFQISYITITAEVKDQLEFTVPNTVIACAEYIWFPDSDPNINLALTAPDGTSVTRRQDGGFSLIQTGIYSVMATEGNSNLCPVVKTFESEITQPNEIGIDLRPFCSEDSSTTVDLLDNSDGLSISWFKNSSNGIENLALFENSRQLIVSDEGSYQVTLSDMNGCLIGRTDFEVLRSSTDPPALNSLYSFCPDSNEGVEIEAGDRFTEVSWMLNGNRVSNERVFIPEEAGQYQLEAKDLLGCSFFSEFVVEEKCEPELRFPNAIWINDPNRFFEIYPDNLIDEIEVKIFNRWGQLIYHCEDNAPNNEIKSSCVWDGTFNGVNVSNGSYATIINFKNHKLNQAQTIRTSIMVID